MNAFPGTQEYNQQVHEYDYHSHDVHHRLLDCSGFHMVEVGHHIERLLFVTES